MSIFVSIFSILTSIFTTFRYNELQGGSSRRLLNNSSLVVNSCCVRDQTSWMYLLQNKRLKQYFRKGNAIICISYMGKENRSAGDTKILKLERCCAPYSIIANYWHERFHPHWKAMCFCIFFALIGLLQEDSNISKSTTKNMMWSLLKIAHSYFKCKEMFRR